MSDYIPKGYKKLDCEVFVGHGNIVILGEPEKEEHNCDEMGCGSMDHVIYRGDIRHDDKNIKCEVE